MRANPGPVTTTHHAILVVGEGPDPRLFHWSYRSRRFTMGVLNGQIDGRKPVLTCRPTRDFVAKKLTLLPAPSESDYVRYSARDAYRIPIAWQAAWSGGMLRLAATAPDFRPLTRRWDELEPRERDSNWVFVDWNPSWLLSLMKDTTSEHSVDLGMKFGLSKSETVTNGKDGKRYTEYHYLAYGDDRGIDTTFISCRPPSETFAKSCQHRFIN